MLDGIKLIEPRAGNGVGQAVAEHLYTATGPRTLRFCLLDGSGAEVCDERPLAVESLVNLGVDVSAQEVAVQAGATASVDVSVRNFAMRGVPAPGGLIAENVVLTGLFDDSSVIYAGSNSNACATSPGGFRCEFGLFDIDQIESFEVQLTGAPDTIYDQCANLRIRASTDSAALNDFFERRIHVDVLADSTDSDGDGMTDAFEVRFGLNVGDPSDAGLDADDDGLSNLSEYQYRTNPTIADSDGDGMTDGYEVEIGTSPVDGSDCPPWTCRGSHGWKLDLYQRASQGN